MPLPDPLTAAVRGYEAELVRNDGPRIDMNKAGWVAELHATQPERDRRYAETQRLQGEIDRTILPDLLARYVNGSDAERQEIRDLLAANPKLRWSLGFSGGLARRVEPPTAAIVRERFVLFSMKDGITADWRDEIVALDSLCAAARSLRMDCAALLREMAALSSDALRGDRSSTRAVLLAREASA